MQNDEPEDTTIYKVVVNHEEQYSIWPADRDNPPGWRDEGTSGSKDACLAQIKVVWTDMRPLSLRRKMEENERRRPELELEEARLQEEASRRPPDPRDDLVEFLSTGDHPVEAALRPEKTLKYLKEALDRGFVHIRFTDTRGGTELGFRVDPVASDLSGVDFERGVGRLTVAGPLTLNDVRVTCRAEIDLATLAGTGRLERAGA